MVIPHVGDFFTDCTDYVHWTLYLVRHTNQPIMSEPVFSNGRLCINGQGIKLCVESPIAVPISTAKQAMVAAPINIISTVQEIQKVEGKEQQRSSCGFRTAVVLRGLLGLVSSRNVLSQMCRMGSSGSRQRHCK